jgi:hypothetical protein
MWASQRVMRYAGGLTLPGRKGSSPASVDVAHNQVGSILDGTVV